MDVKLMQGDCLELMRELPDASVDLVLCDLPYGTTRNKWDAIIPFADMWSEYGRVCRGAFVLTAAQPFTSALVMSKADWFRHNWVWEKSAATGHLNAKRQPMKLHEDVLVFSRLAATYNPQGLVPFNKITRRGGSGANFGAAGNENYQEFTNYPRTILRFPPDLGRSVHPTQKPVALMEYLVRTYSNPGDVVLDNCMGSGTTGVACVNTARAFIGMEMDAGYFEIAQKRITGQTQT